MKIVKSTSRKALEIRASNLIKSRVLLTLKKRKRVILGIPGGRSVKGIFSILSKQKLSWNRIHIFFVDERFVPLSSDESNYNLAKKYFKTNLHPFNYKKPISNYTKEFKKYATKFDIILLSMGEDCHNSSLFPNHSSIKNRSNFFIKVTNSPKPPERRISASKKLLERSTTAILLAFGETKAQALQNLKNPHLSITECPSKLIYAIKDSYVFTDTK